MPEDLQERLSDEEYYQRVDELTREALEAWNADAEHFDLIRQMHPFFGVFVPNFGGGWRRLVVYAT